MKNRTRVRCAAVATLAAGLTAVPTAQAAGARTPVPAASPKANQGAADHGAVAPDRTITLRVYLAPRGGQAALDQAVAAVSDPGSASYGQFLTAPEYRARYTPSDATVAAVEQFATDNGLRVLGVEDHARYITVRGPASAVAAAFATELHAFTRGADSFTAPVRSATVPSTLRSRIGAVSGLSTEIRRMTRRAPAPTSTAPAAFANARPCSTFYGEKVATDQPDFEGKKLPYAPCGYIPSQLRSAYEGNSALVGSGQTVAITDAYAAPTIASDTNTYATRHGDAALTPGQLTERNPSKFTDEKACDHLGWYGEETLDVEAVHGMAPASNILYYGSVSCTDQDFGDTLARVVDDNDASIVTNSWGDTEANETPDGVVAYEQVFEQGALQGITFLFSSGDSGDEVDNTGTKQADYPASDPYITAVGGTATAIRADGALQFQTGWGTHKFSLVSGAWSPLGFLYGAGGGISGLFAQPVYQDGVVPAGGSGRAVPDIAMDADPTTGMLVGETQKFPTGGIAYGEYRIGGTSLASPLMAGMQALRNQATSTRGGFLNPALYGRDAASIADVAGPSPDRGNVRADYINGVDAGKGVKYSVRTFNEDSSLGDGGAVTGGWDSITGIGVPSAAYLVAPATP